MKIIKHTEFEYKFFVKDIRGLRKLLEFHDKKRKRVWEKTIMFDNSQKIMQITDGRVRLRIRKPGIPELSFKKPVKRSGIKIEVEYETKVENPESLIKIFDKMGFQPVSSYERYRTTYQIKNCKVTLDEYPFATFVEIEGLQKEIPKIAMLLGFNPDESIDKSCDTLYTEWRKSLGKPPKTHMLFSDY